MLYMTRESYQTRYVSIKCYYYYYNIPAHSTSVDDDVHVNLLKLRNHKQYIRRMTPTIYTSQFEQAV